MFTDKLQDGESIRLFEITMYDATYHFYERSYTLSSDKTVLKLKKRFNPEWKGYPCSTMLRKDIKLDISNDETGILGVEFDKDIQLFCDIKCHK